MNLQYTSAESCEGPPAGERLKASEQRNGPPSRCLLTIGSLTAQKLLDMLFY